MRNIALNLKPAARLVDIMVMVLAAYFALHASAVRINHQPVHYAPAGIVLLEVPIFSVS